MESLQLLLVCLLQALLLDEMMDNDTELIALKSNDDDVFLFNFSQTKSLRSCSSHTRVLRRGYSKIHRPSVSTSFSYVQANSRATMFTAG